MQDESFMRLALAEAEAAGRRGEVPVGAVAVVGTEVVGRGSNAPIGRSDPTAHAEILALREAAAALGNYRLADATLYTTVEPCLMCVGAALHARVSRLVYGAADPKVGASALLEQVRHRGAILNHRIELHGGVLAAEAAELLRRFFEQCRTRSVDVRTAG